MPMMQEVTIAYGRTSRREDLEDILADPAYFQATFHALSEAKELYHSQAEFGLANETIASALLLSSALVPMRLMRRHQIRISHFRMNYTNYVQRQRMPSMKRRH
jgi:hypothetical protein